MSWVWAGYGLGISLAGYQLAIGYPSAGYGLAIGWQWVGYQLYIKVMVKVLAMGYSLHPLILCCRLHNLAQIIGPVYSGFYFTSPGSIQPC